MTEAIPIWLHLVAATVWVGPQVFMFLVVVPALRAAQDPGARYRATSVLTSRFNMVAWSALALLVLTGIDNIVGRDRAIDAFDFNYRFAWILSVKLALVALTTLLTAYHAFGVGRRIMSLESDPATAAPQRLQPLRRLSVGVSVLNLLLALAILFLAALLGQSFAFEEV